MQRSFFSPSTRRKVDEKAGAAWMAGNACWPMFEDSVKPKIARACVGGREERYGVHGDAFLDADDVVIHIADVAHVVEDERLLRIEAACDDVFRVLTTHPRALFQR